jgi:periplasmic protein TonB
VVLMALFTQRSLTGREWAMFESSFVDAGKTRRPWMVLVGAACEAALLGVVILVPLLFVETLPERGLFKALLLAPVPMAPPAPPPPMIAKRIPRAVVVARKFNPAVLVSPVVVPKEVAIISEAPVLQMDVVVGGVPGGIPGVGVGGTGTGFFGGAVAVAPPPPPPPPKVVAAAPSGPKQITVGGDVEAAMLLHQVQPVYPAMARAARIAGNVRLKAVIGTDGKIKNLTAVSGHPLLVDAAMNAVRQWIYKPTVLDGRLVEVNTEIVVRFGLTTPGAPTG